MEREPHPVIEASLQEDVDIYEMLERFNRLIVMLIKTNISSSIYGCVDKNDNVREFLKAIDEQFKTSHKALGSTLIIKFSSTKLSK